jgi:hypothetical protein
MDRAHKPSDSECCTPSSESFGFNFRNILYIRKFLSLSVFPGHDAFGLASGHKRARAFNCSDTAKCPSSGAHPLGPAGTHWPQWYADMDSNSTEKLTFSFVICRKLFSCVFLWRGNALIMEKACLFIHALTILPPQQLNDFKLNLVLEFCIIGEFKFKRYDILQTKRNFKF